MIKYESAGIDVRVYVNGKLVGTIKRGVWGWRYEPKGSKTHGEASMSLDVIKCSLEG